MSLLFFGTDLLANQEFLIKGNDHNKGYRYGREYRENGNGFGHDYNIEIGLGNGPLDGYGFGHGYDIGDGPGNGYGLGHTGGFPGTNAS